MNVIAKIAMGEIRLKAQGFETDYCLVAPDAAAEGAMVQALA